MNIGTIQGNYDIVRYINENTDKKGKNFVLSTYSIGNILEMLNVGLPSGKAKEELKSLGYKYQNINSNEIKSINCLYSEDSIKLVEAYENNLRDMGVTIGNFHSDTIEQTITELNQLIKNETEGLIEKAISSINASMLYMNILYFKAKWLDKCNTFKSQFNNIDNSHSTVKYMEHNLGKLYENYQGIMVEIPYEREYSFVVIMEKDSDTKINLDHLYESAISNIDLSVEVPEFSVDSLLNITKLFDMLGLKELAKLNNEYNKLLKIGSFDSFDMNQKCVIEVNENGTKAAAVTLGLVNLCCLRMERKIEINRPFTFMIKRDSTNEIMFIGRINKL